MKLTLNGWQRLWVLISVLLIVPIAIVTVSIFPSPNDIKHQSKFENDLSPSAKSKLFDESKSKAATDKNEIIWDNLVGLTVKMPNGHVLEFNADAQNDDAEKVAAEYYDILKNEARKQRLEYAVYGVLSWLSIIVLIYIFGWSIGWVCRGFKKSH